ncbi:putative glycosyl [Erysiphe neolycopersici]|uniref:Putative glycosyl n=1 Tax=Erysiphe neolycopersici TaxID=212602 RepID=A0A420HZY1_9PEZI|nr:putative glycosyl [Erysiphe neolycopersici]
MSTTQEAGDFVFWTIEEANKGSTQQVSEYALIKSTTAIIMPDLKPLRNYLRSRDVFVEKRRGIKMAAALNKTCMSNYKPLLNREQIKVLPQFKSQLPTSNSHPQPALPQPYQCQNEDKVTATLINLRKIRKDNQKYGGFPDEFFQDKFATFTENCNTVGLRTLRHNEAFHIMPEGKERESMLRSQWKETSLFSILADHPETQKDVDKAFTLLVPRLRHLQQDLSAPYRSEEIFYGKLIDSCKGHPATNIACSTTPRGDTSIDFINRAKANISTWKASQGMTNNPRYLQ